MNDRGTGLACPSATKRTLACDDGSKLEYFVVGESGPHLVCVNALGQDLLLFSHLVARFSASHRLVAWKARNFPGRSSTNATVRDQIEDLATIVSAEAIDACALIAWCSGAKVALEFARKTRAVRSVVVANGTYARLSGLEHLETAFESTFMELCKTVVDRPEVTSFVKDAMTGLVTRTGPARAFAGAAAAADHDGPLRRLIIEPFQSVEATQAYAHQVVDYLSHDIAPALAALDVPLLVLSGNQDHISSPAMARAVTARASHGSFIEVASGSHYCLYENAVESLSAIEAFLGHSEPIRSRA